MKGRDDAIHSDSEGEQGFGGGEASRGEGPHGDGQVRRPAGQGRGDGRGRGARGQLEGTCSTSGVSNTRCLPRKNAMLVSTLTGVRRLVDLVVEIQMLAARDDVRDVRHELAAVAHQRVVVAFRAAGCSCVPTTTELSFTASRFDVRHDEIGFVRAERAVLVLADDDLHAVRARRHLDAGLVLHGLLLQIVGGIGRQPHGVADAADRPPLLVAHDAEHVERRLVLVGRLRDAESDSQARRPTAARSSGCRRAGNTRVETYALRSVDDRSDSS